MASNVDTDVSKLETHESINKKGYPVWKAIWEGGDQDIFGNIQRL